MIAEHAPGASPQTKRYVHGAGVDNPLVEYSRQGDGTYVRSWYAADYKGSIVATTDDAGTSQAIYSYGDFGEPNTLGGAAFRYTGQRLDPDSGLYYYKARWYSANLGRFLQADPVGTKDQINLYAYVANDPINLTDPLGLYICDCSKSDTATMENAFAMAWNAYDNMDPNSNEAFTLWTDLVYASTDAITITPKSLDPFNLGFAEPGGKITLDLGQLQNRATNEIRSSNPGMSTQDVGLGLIAATIAHEVNHAMDSAVLGSWNDFDHELQSELDAYSIQQSVQQSLGMTTKLYSPTDSQEVNDSRVFLGAWGSTVQFCQQAGAQC